MKSSSTINILGKAVRKQYLELIIVIVAGLVYGVSKRYFDNDWYAVIVGGGFLIIGKLVIEKVSRANEKIDT